MANGTKKIISLWPGDFEMGGGGGGAYNDLDLTIVDARCAMRKYPGREDIPASPAIYVLYRPDNEEIEDFDRHYSAGRADRLEPTSDGASFQQADGSGAEGLNSTCNAAQYLQALIDASGGKFKKENFSRIQNLIGTHGFFHLVPQTERNFKDRKATKPQTILVAEKIDKFPWENTVSPPQANGQQASFTAPADLYESATQAVLLALEKANAPIETKNVGVRAFSAVPDGWPHRSKFFDLCVTQDFLTRKGVPWSVKGDYVVLTK